MLNEDVDSPLKTNPGEPKPACFDRDATVGFSGGLVEVDVVARRAKLGVLALD